MKRVLVGFLIATVCAFARPASGHHSFSATYLEGQTVTIQGEIVQFVFRNPHSFVHVNVKQNDGTLVTYNVEWGGTSQLGNRGIAGGSLRAGDIVVITGSPGRNADDHRIRLLTLTRPKDGLTWGQRPGEVSQ